MSNEEVLTAFSEWLQMYPVLCEIPANDASTIVREFAAAIDPVPLAEATIKEMRVFERDHKVPATPVRPVPLSLEYARKRYINAMAELRYHEYQAVMLSFRQFRDSVLKNRAAESVHSR